MTTITQAERMMRLETNLDNLNKKVDSGFDDIKSEIKQLASTVQQVMPSVVTKTEMDKELADLNKEITNLKSDLEKSKTRNSIQTFVTSSLSAVLAVVMTILLQAYFNR